ncbi:MAG: TIGR03943 family protein [Chthoniobacterales bacterium]
MKNKITSLLAPVTLLEWGGVLLYFYLSGRLSAFLHPSFRPQVLIAGIVLVLCAITLFLTRNQKAVCECGIVENCPEQTRSPFVSSWLFPIMLLLPLAIAATFTRDSYGSNILATRGIADSAAALPGLADKMSKTLPVPKVTATTPTIEPALPDANPNASSTPPPTEDQTAEDFFKPDANGNIQVNVADLLYAAEEPTLRKPFVGKSAEIIGQFMPAKGNNPTGNRFKLVRLFMTCCAADAQPVSLLIEHDTALPIPSKISDMTWTKVVGDIAFSIENGRTIAVIKAKKIEPIDPPEETMLY